MSEPTAYILFAMLWLLGYVFLAGKWRGLLRGILRPLARIVGLDLLQPQQIFRFKHESPEHLRAVSIVIPCQDDTDAASGKFIESPCQQSELPGVALRVGEMESPTEATQRSNSDNSDIPDSQRDSPWGAQSVVSEALLAKTTAEANWSFKELLPSLKKIIQSVVSIRTKLISPTLSHMRKTFRVRWHSLIQKYRFRSVILALAVLGVFGTLLIGVGYTLQTAYADAKEFRQLPMRGSLERVFERESLHNIVTRTLIFARGGSPDYYATLHAWTYGSVPMKDNWWNRQILDRDIANNMNDEELAKQLPYYPFTPSRAMREKMVQILNREGDKRLLVPILKSAGGSKHVEEWLDKSRDEIDLDSIKQEQEWSSSWADHRYLMSAIAYAIESLGAESDQSSVLFSWLSRNIEARKIAVDTRARKCLVKFANAGRYRSDAQRLLIENYVKDSYGEDLDVIVSALDPSNEIAVTLFDEFRTTDINAALRAFEVVLAQSEARAIQISNSILQDDTDSMLRKGIIVLLANHDNWFGLERIDEAFMGRAPLTVQFDSVQTIVGYSSALREYEVIADHGYTQTGKKYPPARNTDSLDARREEAIKWKLFIEKYPWFPATDDAYYRLAFAQWTTGSASDALNTLQRYSESTFFDNDSKDIIAHFLSAMLRVDQVRAETIIEQQSVLKDAREILGENVAMAMLRGWN